MALAAGALVATSALTAGAVAQDRSSLGKAARSAQPTKVSTMTTTRQPAGKASSGTAALAALAAGQAPAPASCVNVAIASGSSPAGGYLPLSAYGIPPVAGVGDETITNFNVPTFDFNGVTYSRVGISSNGYVEIGGGTTTEFVNQAFPDSTAPNGVLAPFWTDLNPNLGGVLRIGTLTNGADYWTVIDWDGFAEFSGAGAKLHSFQVWIGENSDANPGEDVSYVYGNQNGNGDGGFLTVGAENNTGTVGQNYYLDGVGTLPSDGTQLVVTSGGGGPVSDFTTTPGAGNAPLHVDFDGSASRDDGTLTSYDWDFGDGTTGSGPTTSHDYDPGIYTASLTVTDNDTNTCTATREIVSNGGFSVNDVAVNESAGTATFTVSRLGGDSATVDVSTAPGSALTPADFTATSTTLVFGPGELSKTVDVSIAQDSVDEANETYSVVLNNATAGGIVDGTGVGTIVDDDPAVRIYVNDNNVTEGNTGTKNLYLAVRLNRASEKTVKVRVRTADGSARAPSDYTTRVVTLTFNPGQRLKTVSIAVKGDRAREPNETFFLLLDRPFNASLADPSGTGGIINND